MNRIFEPLPHAHPAIGTLQCAVCKMTFQAGDVTTLVPKPGGERDGFTVEADLLHAACAPTDDELFATMAVELRERRAFTLVLRPLVALQLAGLLQLVRRHPELSDDNDRTAADVIEHVRQYFADAPSTLEVLRRGDDPDHDVSEANEKPDAVMTELLIIAGWIESRFELTRAAKIHQRSQADEIYGLIVERIAVRRTVVENQPLPRRR